MSEARADDDVRPVPVLAVRRTRTGLSWRVGYLALASVPPSFAGIFAVSAVYGAGAMALVLLLLFAPIVVFCVGIVLGQKRDVASDAVSVRAGKLRLAPGLPEVPLADVMNAAVANGGVARIETRTEVWELVPKEQSAERLLASLGLGPGEHTLTFSGGRVYLRLLLWLAGLPAVVYAAVYAANEAARRGVSEELWRSTIGAAAAGLVVCLLLALHRALRSTVTVGADGVLVRSLGLSRLYGLDQLREASDDYGTLVLELEGGRVRRLPVGWGMGSNAQVMVERINAAHEARRQGASGAALALPARVGRSIDEWRGSLGALVGRAEGYRVGSVEVGALRAVVGNTAVGVERRVAAVLALERMGDREARERVRAAVETEMLGRVRAALEGAASGSLDEETLAEAEREEAEAQGRARR